MKQLLTAMGLCLLMAGCGEQEKPQETAEAKPVTEEVQTKKVAPSSPPQATNSKPKASESTLAPLVEKVCACQDVSCANEQLAVYQDLLKLNKVLGSAEETDRFVQCVLQAGVSQNDFIKTMRQAKSQE